MELNEIKKTISDHNVQSIALQFVDAIGKLYSLWIPSNQLESVIKDGAGMSGWPYFAPIERSDIILKPDFESFRVLPWSSKGKGYAAVFCDLYEPTGSEIIKEAPRSILKSAIKTLKEKLGEDVEACIAPECEYFLLKRTEQGELKFHDNGSYLSLPPVDKGFEVRDDVTHALIKMGINVEKNHHEVPRGKHEIIIEYDKALTMADKIQYVKQVIKMMAYERGIIASYMPKPFDWELGAGWHTHFSLTKNGKNLFYDEDSKYGISDTGLFFIAGLLRHARALPLITNPTVNSYKRLVPGSQAPIYVAWSKFNRTAFLRIPASTPQATRFEYRASDGACNVYLSFAAMIHAGLDGIARKEMPPEPVDENIYVLTAEERQEKGIDQLPGNLGEAILEFERNETIRQAIKPLDDKYLSLKKAEWHEYSRKVFDWERERYLDENSTTPI